MIFYRTVGGVWAVQKTRVRGGSRAYALRRLGKIE